MKHYRGLLFLLLCSLLAGLTYYAGSRPPWVDLKDCVKNPGQYDGRLVTYIREPRVLSITQDGFILKYGSGTILVRTAETPPGFKAGEYIGMTAVFHKEGFLTPQKLIVARNRRYKILLSVIPVMLVAGLFFRYFKWNHEKLQAEIRRA